MKPKLFEGQSKKVIIDNLESLCHSKQEMVYMKNLDEQTLQKKEKEFVADNIKLSKLKDDFDKVKEEFKNKMKPVEQMLVQNLNVLKNKAEEVEGTVYLIDDQEEGLMGYYDLEGNLLNSRRLTADERQLHIGSKLAANG